MRIIYWKRSDSIESILNSVRNIKDFLTIDGLFEYEEYVSLKAVEYIPLLPP